MSELNNDDKGIPKSNDSEKALTKTTGSKSSNTTESGGGGNYNLQTHLLSQISSTGQTMTDAELIYKIRQMEIDKNNAKYEKYQKKQAKNSEQKTHAFWNTQPMPGNQKADGEEVKDHGPVDLNTDLETVRKEPLNMPNGFDWCSVDIMDPVQAQEVYKLLTENYVEDDECMFRFDYSIPFLQWALTPPGYRQEWHVGVRASKTGKLMGFITAIPANVRIYEVVKDMVEINFLCVHKKLRTNRLAPVLIKEITRRVNITGRWQACYTAGVYLPKPIAQARYYHRSLQPKKLIEIKFSSLPQKETMASHLAKLKLPERPVHKLRAASIEDIPRVHELITESLKRRNLAQEFSVEELAHILTPRPDVVQCYVKDTDGIVTDVCSFYHLPSSVIGHPKHSKLNAVYSYYNVATTMPFVDLMRDALIIARNNGADVFNALNVQGNEPIFEPLKFGVGDGNLQYYVYNWKAPEIVPGDIGLVLL